MQKYVDILQKLLSEPELTATEVKEGIISAYIVVTCLNQSQGNPDVGLKQSPEGLYSHINGFMGAVFWERGFDAENPSLEQLADTKIMMDGMTQIYAMPEDIQAAFNDLYEYFISRAKGVDAVVSSKTRELLGIKEGAAPAKEAYSASEKQPAAKAKDQYDAVQDILSEVPSEMESDWDSTPPLYPAAEEPGLATESESLEEASPQVKEFDPSKVFAEEEPPVMLKGETKEAKPRPPAEKFDPTQFLIEKPSAVPESESETTKLVSDNELETSTPLSESETETPVPLSESEPETPATPVESASGYPPELSIISEPDLQPARQFEVISNAKPPVQDFTPKRRKRTRKTKAVSAKDGEQAKPKRRGRKKKVASQAGAEGKPKRKRNIKPKKVKIDLASISVPDSYMSPEEMDIRAGIDKPGLSGVYEPTTQGVQDLGEAQLPEMQDFASLDETESGFTSERRPPLMDEEGPPAKEAEETDAQMENDLAQAEELESGYGLFESAEETTKAETEAETDFEAQAPAFDFPAPDQDTSAELAADMKKIKDTQPYASAEDTATMDARVSDSIEPMPLGEEAGMAAEPSEKEIAGWESILGADTEEADKTGDVSFADQLEKEPAPESSPSSWTELGTEPVEEGGMPMKQDMQEKQYYEQDSGYSAETGRAPVTSAEITGERPPWKGGLNQVITALVLGLVLGGSISYIWFGILQPKQIRARLQVLEKEVQAGKEAEKELGEVRGEFKRLTDLVNKQRTSARAPLEKPQYYRIKQGVLIYWIDTSLVQRKYYFYRAKGERASLNKLSAKPMSKNMIYIKKVSPGTWRYAVSAVDVDGKETEKSKVLRLNF